MSRIIETPSELMEEIVVRAGRIGRSDMKLIVRDTFANKRYTARAVVMMNDELVIEVRPENVITEEDLVF